MHEKRTYGADGWKQDENPHLLKITSLFFEGLTHRPKEQRTDRVRCRRPIDRSWQNDASPKRSCLATPGALRRSADEQPAASAGCDNQKRRIASSETLQDFMRGISNSFNNIYMGIWGNVSLIRMCQNKPDCVGIQIRQIERLIQHGAVLIDIVFGYLSEGSAAMRHLRLHQLLQEVQSASASKSSPMNMKQIEEGLIRASHFRHPIRLARSVTRVFENLLVWIAARQKDLSNREGLEDAVRLRVANIGRLVTRGLALTDQLKMYTGDAPRESRRIRLKALIKHTLNQVDPCGSRVRLAADLSIPLPDLHADRAQLQTALMHVLHNAVEASPRGGLVQLSTRWIKNSHRQKTRNAHPSGDYVVITIRDRGEGMSRRIRSRIFDPFFVGRKRTNHLGLGLAVSQGIVTAHGGHIHVRSYRGRGSTFSICLPVYRENPRCRSFYSNLPGIVSQMHVETPAMYAA